MTRVNRRLIWLAVVAFLVSTGPTMAGPRARVDKDVERALRVGTTQKLVIVKARPGEAANTLHFLVSNGKRVKKLREDVAHEVPA